MLEDYYVESEKRLIAVMQELEIPSENISQTIANEKPHFNKAVQLGHAPRYGIQIEFVGKKIRRYKGFTVLPPNVPKKDLIKIALAPENPSESDYALARQNGWRPEND